MKPVKIPREQRLFLIGPARLSPGSVFRAVHLTRWMGRYPKGGVLARSESGGWRLESGCCGHCSFFWLQIRLHRHPDSRPVPGDLKAALRGEAPIPDWFTEGRAPDGPGDPGRARDEARQ